MHVRRLILPILAVLCLGAGIALGLRLLAPDPAPPAPGLAIAPFALVGPQGQVVTERPTQDRWRLVVFGHAGCSDICMEALAELAEALDALGEDTSRVEALFVTIDPGRDSVEDLASFAATFDGRIVPLTGSQAQVDQAMRAFHVGVEETGPAPAQGAGAPDAAAPRPARRSTPAAFLVAPSGRLVRLFGPGTPGVVMAEVLRDLLGPVATPVPLSAGTT
ncbi:SCO family protein [Zavarzinia sp. CC-PAN008]|uniref:SCO family protein n=1 Tax=Zavarzinia sp. CC-PAN008 TaxID=3243332 RepID=UPI003F74849F